MHAEAVAHPGAMAAILGLEDDKVRAALGSSAAGQVLSCANFNSPGQVVISGEKEAVERAMAACKEAGALKCVPLAVSGAFHSALMRPAGEKLRAAFGSIEWQVPRPPVISNVDAKPKISTAELQESLVTQVFSSVLWTESVRLMLAQGVTRFIELGPGKVLQGLLKKIDRSASCISIGDKESLAKAMEWQKN
jgi:[acyl-carrier-protein] S-malonyltransferase